MSGFVRLRALDVIPGSVKPAPCAYMCAAACGWPHVRAVELRAGRRAGAVCEIGCTDPLYRRIRSDIGV